MFSSHPMHRWSRACSMECVRGIGPQYGWASFDNIGTASLTVFTIIALEGWTEILYADTVPIRCTVTLEL